MVGQGFAAIRSNKTNRDANERANLRLGNDGGLLRLRVCGPQALFRVQVVREEEGGGRQQTKIPSRCVNSFRGTLPSLGD
jgi:hypothetical protein